MVKSYIFAKSALGIPVPAYEFNNNGPHVLILGGVHGDEIEGVIAAQGLLDSFLKNFNYHLNVTLVPAFNPDGVLYKTRTNGNGVDLNRNLPTKDWTEKILNPRYVPGPHPLSEPENQALDIFIKQNPLALVISLHSWKPMININGNCEPEASIIHKLTNYRIDSDMGYPTPGSLGTYAGKEKNIPTITYEIERGLNAPEILRVHVPAILEALKASEKRSKGTR